MNVIIKNDYRVEVLLTADELEAFDITYDELDYGNIETRRVLWTLMSDVRKISGVDIDLSGKLLIEVAREQNDRYRICFSSIPPRGSDAPSVKQLIKNTEKPLVLECCGLDDAVNAALSSKFDGVCGLFFADGRYRLVFDVSGSERIKTASRISEFGELLADNGDRLLAECREHWKCIEETAAVEKLKMLA